jgi:O-methyltransferase
MNPTSRKLFKNLATRLPYSQRVEYLLALPKLRNWERTNAAHLPRLGNRAQFFERTSETLAEPVLYLEFGVWEGRSMQWWHRSMGNPDSRFVGFDTFTGLPESWRHGLSEHPAGTFDAEGKPPQIDDPRVDFRKGLFQETLPAFLEVLPSLVTGRSLIVNLDADLYSSTLYVLTMLDRQLPGALVLFDQFSSVLDEMRALLDYCAAYRRQYDVIVCTRHLDKVAVRFR